jgi:hypothetical protein
VSGVSVITDVIGAVSIAGLVFLGACAAFSVMLAWGHMIKQVVECFR